MVDEFWDEKLTKASWEKLLELSKEYKFIVIGGWAAYLWTKAHKSKDIDIVIDHDTLRELMMKFDVVKNERMKKYEIKLDKFDIDIYLPFFSRLAIPLEELDLISTNIDGLRVPQAEALLLLKQAAEIDRRNSIKGKKDSIDILTILAHTDIDWKKYSSLAKKYKLENYPKELLAIVNRFEDADIHYLKVGFVQYKKLKKKLIREITEIL